MKKNLSAISLIVLSLVTACASPITNSKTLQNNETTSKTIITGKAEFPQSTLQENSKESTLKTKDNISEMDDKIKVVLTYPSDHPVLDNETIYTTITDTQGNFTIKPYSNFVPKINEIFLLEASKRINSTSMKVKTFIKWNGTTWDSITTPSLKINAKTKVLVSMIELLSPKITANDSIGKIIVSENSSTPSDIKPLNEGSVLIKGTSINNVSNFLVDYILSKNQDPLEYLVYENGEITFREPTKIMNTITTIAGNGDSIFLGDNEKAIYSGLNDPHKVRFDSNGNMYITDNVSIRKVDVETGIITTIAGNGQKGYSGDGGQATNAKFNSITGIAFDSIDNLYISDYYNNSIRKVNKNTGIISTVIRKDGFGYEKNIEEDNKSELYYPIEIIFDRNDNLYIADNNNNKISKVDVETGIITTIAGNGKKGYSGDGSQATNSMLNNPIGISLDSEETYIFRTIIIAV